MFEKIKKILNEKDDKKKTENLIAFLIILIITLILINKIWNDDSNKKEEMYHNQAGVELVSSNIDGKTVLVDNNLETEDSLEKNLQDILSKINGVGEVQILITYQKENPLKIEGAIVIAEGARKYRS